MAYQVSIFLEDKAGHFENVTSVLRSKGINIRSMTLNDTANGWGILSILVDQPKQAVEALAANGMSAVLRPILAFEMEDKPGGLDEVLIKIASAGISFRNAYGRVIDSHKKAFLFIDVNDYDLAREKLIEQGVIPVEDDVIYSL